MFVGFFYYMIIIEKTLLSDEVCDAYFVCDLKQCKGKCCVEGDFGAPLQEEEVDILESELEKIKAFMTAEGIEVVNKQGVFVLDMEGVLVTPLIDNKQCAFVYYEDEIALCAIEKAYKEKKISYPKPISCHLYPIRILNQPAYDAVNYHQWEICENARDEGIKQDIPLYVYLKEGLTRKYGSIWYDILDKYLQTRK